jgi:hypothetical protein
LLRQFNEGLKLSPVNPTEENEMETYQFSLESAQLDVEKTKQALETVRENEASTLGQLRDARNQVAAAEARYLEIKYFPLSQSVIDIIEEANVDAKDAVFVSKLIADAVKVAIKFPSKRAQPEPLVRRCERTIRTMSAMYCNA